ncbi:MAG TPA: hypothetical protein VFQ67_08105 [Allosphingosinicella sp.]|nr:hypothetical protein [Allosphingosinicella sp.]
MRRPIACLVLLACLVACRAAPRLAPPGAHAAPAGGFVVLPADVAAALYRQCSRSSPPPPEGWWQPEAEDLARFEAALPAAAAAAREGPALDLSRFATEYHRQYVGTLRAGRRLIYGNFYQAGLAAPGRNWRREPTIACDGAPSFFGAEYDVESGTITHLAFNGG